jgi:hypothetical protein
MKRSGVIFAILLGLSLWSSASRADDPLFVDWSSLLPSFVDTFTPNSANDCVAGRPHCVDAVIREMKRRFQPQGQSCDHDAIFALAYLRTTQMFQWANAQPGFFADAAWLNHYDVVFAKYYLRASDDYAAGRRSAVPQAWLVAFDAAANRQVSGSGSLLLGMNAHVNRDLPFVLAAIGLVAPSGTSRKPDHDKVNQFLNLVTDPLLVEASARFDPGTSSVVTPLGVGTTALFQTLAMWREEAWRQAERLVSALTSIDRSVIAAQIETSAATEARAIAAGNAYVPPLSTSASRDAFCAANNGAAAPEAYAFGTPDPY